MFSPDLKGVYAGIGLMIEPNSGPRSLIMGEDTSTCCSPVVRRRMMMMMMMMMMLTRGEENRAVVEEEDERGGDADQHGEGHDIMRPGPRVQHPVGPCKPPLHQERGVVPKDLEAPHRPSETLAEVTILWATRTSVVMMMVVMMMMIMTMMMMEPPHRPPEPLAEVTILWKRGEE
jgi:hypothetical protein